MPILASEALLCENKKNPVTKRDDWSWYHWLQVKHFPVWTNLAFDCKIETLGSSYSHGLLIPTKSSKFKNQVDEL